MLDRIVPISEVRREHQLSQTGHIRGKIVLRVEPERNHRQETAIIAQAGKFTWRKMRRAGLRPVESDLWLQGEPHGGYRYV
jgi:hypothetical protein